MKVLEVKNVSDLSLYQKLTERWLGIRYPMAYLKKASVYMAWDHDGSPIGGFCIQSQPPFRVLESVPKDVVVDNVESPVELTGLWFRPGDKRASGRVIFWLALCVRFFRYTWRNVVFAYSRSKPGLARSYAYSNPKVLFSGVTRIQPGMSEVDEEVVCVTQGYRIALLPLLRPSFYIRRFRERRSHVSHPAF